MLGIKPGDARVFRNLLQQKWLHQRKFSNTVTYDRIFEVNDKSTYEKGEKTIWNFKKVNSWRDFFRVKNLNITYVDANEMYGFGNEETIGFHNHTENVVQG